jgi:hypothetical protein
MCQNIGDVEGKKVLRLRHWISSSVFIQDFIPSKLDHFPSVSSLPEYNFNHRDCEALV